MDTNHEHSTSPVDTAGAERKPRIDEGGSPSPLQMLKMLPDEAHDLLLAQRNEMSLHHLIMEIKSAYGIEGLIPQRLSDFFAWLSLRRMKEDAAAFRESFGASNATLEEAHEAALSSLLLTAARENNNVLLRFALGEIRRARTLGQSAERLEIMERRVAVLERRFEAAYPPRSKEMLTEEEKAQKIREVFGLS